MGGDFDHFPVSFRHFQAVPVKAFGFALRREPGKHHHGLGFPGGVLHFLQQRIGGAALFIAAGGINCTGQQFQRLR